MSTLSRFRLLASAGLAALLAASSAATPLDDAVDLLEQATAARTAGDSAKALELYQRGADLLASVPSQRGAMGLIVRADLQHDIARVMRQAGKGDPCDALDKGRAYLEQARGVLPAGDADIALEAIESTQQLIVKERQRNHCAAARPPVDPGLPSQALVGHYYLSGVMETGSELLLRADGRFDWYISYGAVDQFVKGRWGRTGDTVTLVADVASKDAPLFRLDERAEWNEWAEERQRAMQRTQLADAIARRCPWIIAAASSAPLLLPDDPPKPGPAEIARAEAAKSAALKAQALAAQAMARAVAEGAGEAEMAAADRAVSAWYEAQSGMDQAYRTASLPTPVIGQPALPAACQLPEQPDVRDIPRGSWQRGIAVVVGDPAREMRFSRISVTFVYSDGHRETAQTSNGGLAFAPVRKGATVNQLELATPEPDQRQSVLTIDPLAEGIQTVVLDSSQIIAPAFEVMRLAVEGEHLLPPDFPRGRYSRH